MSYIDNIGQAYTAGTATASDTANTTDIMGKQDFLTLLVAQLQNQDPLNPDDPTEFTAQLAQFSSLEQLFNLNDSMQSLADANANANQMTALQTIGKYVVYQDSEFEYDGETPIQLGYQLDAPAADVQITISQNGSPVAVLNGEELSKGNHFLTWDGTNIDGYDLGPGSFTFSITAIAIEDSTVAAEPLIKSEVTGVDLSSSSGGKLLTRAGEITFSSILGVYEIEDEEITDIENDSGSDSYYDYPSSYNFGKKIISEATDEVAKTADNNVLKDDGQVSFNFNL